MNIRNLFPAGFVLLLCTLDAAPIAINNAGFESGSLPLIGNGTFSQLVPGSTIFTHGGSLSDWTVDYSTADATAGGFAPSPGGNNWTSTWWSGNNVGYLQVGVAGGTVSLTQALAATLQNDATYTLTALIGNRQFGNLANHSIQILAGGTLVAGSGSNAAQANNSNGIETLVFNPGSNNPFANQQLSIRLLTVGQPGSTTSALTEAFFDDISFDVVTNSSSVPEPSTWFAAGVGLAGIVLSKRFRQRSN